VGGSPLISARIRRYDRLCRWSAALAGVSLAVWVGWIGPATAEVRVAGGVNAVKLEARNATLDEILAALRRSYKFNYRSAGNLGGAVSGTYSGSLRAVVTHLLDGRNYVIHATSNRVEALIFATGGTGSLAPAQMGPPPLKECKYDDGVHVIPVEC